LKWRDIGENTAIPKEERKIWVNIDVPAEKTKTGRSYRVAAPIAKFLERIRVITKYKKMDDYIFTNQDSGKQRRKLMNKNKQNKYNTTSKSKDWFPFKKRQFNCWDSPVLNSSERGYVF
tara:strand:+ start:185 stop:541 length:357 start_codon:yes stop_codon:yes gene_type:complete